MNYSLKKVLSCLAGVVVMTIAVMNTACTSNSQLDLAIRIAAADCPMVIDEMTTVTDIFREEGNVVYACSVDEGIAEVSVSELDMPLIRDVMKNAMLETLKEMNENDDDFKEFVKLCKDAGCNIVYRYIGSESGYSMDIPIYPSEL